MIAGRIKQHIEYEETHDSGITSVVEAGERQEKVVIIDADSLLYISSWRGKDEEGNKIPDWTPEEYGEAEAILAENLMRIYNAIEEYFDVSAIYLCVKGRRNFRYDLFPEYKAGRPPTPDVVKHLRKYLVSEHGALQADLGEADDLVYSISLETGHKAIIAAIDKDLCQIPGIHFNYQRNKWALITPKEARYRFAFQMIMGDCGDNVNLTPKHGIKYAEKVLHREMTDRQYLRQVMIVFKKCWGKEWRDKLYTAYQLLKLHRIDYIREEKEKRA